MNYIKAQQDVFKALINGLRVCCFDLDNEHTCITPDGFKAWIFPNDVLMVNVEKIQRFNPLEITPIIKPENKLELTLDLRMSGLRSKELLHKLKGGGKDVFVRETFLKYFQNANYYQALDKPVSHIVVTETVKGNERPVGIVLPMRIYNEHV